MDVSRPNHADNNYVLSSLMAWFVIAWNLIFFSNELVQSARMSGFLWGILTPRWMMNHCFWKSHGLCAMHGILLIRNNEAFWHFGLVYSCYSTGNITCNSMPSLLMDDRCLHNLDLSKSESISRKHCFSLTYCIYGWQLWCSGHMAIRIKGLQWLDDNFNARVYQ